MPVSDEARLGRGTTGLGKVIRPLPAPKRASKVTNGRLEAAIQDIQPLSCEYLAQRFALDLVTFSSSDDFDGSTTLREALLSSTPPWQFVQTNAQRSFGHYLVRQICIGRMNPTESGVSK